MRRSALVAAACLGLTATGSFGVGRAVAEPRSPAPKPAATDTEKPCKDSPLVCVKGGGSTGQLGAGATDGSQGADGTDASPLPSGHPGNGRAQVTLSENVTRHQYILACQGNTVDNGGDINCNAARAICSGDGPGYLAYWRYAAEFVRATNKIVAPGWQRTDTQCLLLGPLHATVDTNGCLNRWAQTKPRSISRAVGFA